MLGLKLAREQGTCPLCQRSFNELIAEAERKAKAAGKRAQLPIALDHDHTTGQVRGALCRGCNGAEGKVSNVVATWGKCGQDDAAIREWLQRLMDYWKLPQLNFIYHDHVTEADKVKKAADKRVLAARAKVNVRRKAIEAARKRQ